MHQNVLDPVQSRTFWILISPGYCGSCLVPDAVDLEISRFGYCESSLCKSGFCGSCLGPDVVDHVQIWMLRARSILIILEPDLLSDLTPDLSKGLRTRSDPDLFRRIRIWKINFVSRSYSGYIKLYKQVHNLKKWSFSNFK